MIFLKLAFNVEFTALHSQCLGISRDKSYRHFYGRKLQNKQNKLTRKHVALAVTYKGKIFVTLTTAVDKHKPTRQNLDRDFNFRYGRSCLQCNSFITAKRSNLKLKNFA